MHHRNRTSLFLFSGLVLALAAGGILSSCGTDSLSGPGGGTLTTPSTFTIMSQRDTDGDGIIDLLDPDDDNDGIPDISDPDDDNDGIPDDMESDSDGDGTIDDHDDDFAELKGQISSIDSSGIVVSNRVVLVTEATRIEGHNDIALPFDSLRVGMFVEVHGNLLGDGSIDATKIEAEGQEDEGLPLDSLDVGAFVEVRGFVDGTGVLFAREVHPHAVDRLGYDAAVDSVTATRVSLLGIDFIIDGATDFRDDTSGGRILADLAGGDPVEVDATYDAGAGTYHADRIRLVSEVSIKVQARIGSINRDAGLLVVGGVTFHL